MVGTEGCSHASIAARHSPSGPSRTRRRQVHHHLGSDTPRTLPPGRRPRNDRTNEPVAWIGSATNLEIGVQFMLVVAKDKTAAAGRADLSCDRCGAAFQQPAPEMGADLTWAVAAAAGWHEEQLGGIHWHRCPQCRLITG